MAEASDSKDVSGQFVAVGNNNTINNITGLGGLVPDPDKLPPGTQITVHLTIGGVDNSGAASHVEYNESQAYPEQHQQRQQSQPRHREQHSQQQGLSQRQAQPQQQQDQQRTPPQQQQHAQWPTTTQQRQQVQQRTTPQEQQQAQQRTPSQQQQQAQQRTLSQQQQHSQQETPPQQQQQAQHRAQFQQQQPSRARQKTTPRLMRQQACEVIQQTSQDSRFNPTHIASEDNPCSSTTSADNCYAMPLQPSLGLYGRSVSTPVQETGGDQQHLLQRSLTEPKRPADLLYSLDPAQCPSGSESSQPSPSSLRVQPKIINSPDISTIISKIDEDKHPPIITDIICVPTNQTHALLMTDMANHRIKSIPLEDGTIKSRPLDGVPVCLTYIGNGKAVVGYLGKNVFSIFDISTLNIERNITTKKQYIGICAVAENHEIAAGCKESQSVDIVNLDGKISHSYKPIVFRAPSCVRRNASCFLVTDWESNTLTSMTQTGVKLFSVSLLQSGQSCLRGIAIHERDIYVADETNNQILCFDVSGRSVRVVLDTLDGIRKPNGICIHDGKMYISQGEGEGHICVWTFAQDLTTRL